ncbi:MAG: hypothetical protein K2P84_08145, partial [Undibacterium sp.]|nr:hypothetical protein [Undibacterium sp.]
FIQRHSNRGNFFRFTFAPPLMDALESSESSDKACWRQSILYRLSHPAMLACELNLIITRANLH